MNLFGSVESDSSRGNLGLQSAGPASSKRNEDGAVITTEESQMEPPSMTQILFSPPKQPKDRKPVRRLTHLVG